MTQAPHPPERDCIFCRALRDRRNAAGSSRAVLAAAEFAEPAAPAESFQQQAQAILPQRRLAAGEMGDW